MQCVYGIRAQHCVAQDVALELPAEDEEEDEAEVSLLTRHRAPPGHCPRQLARGMLVFSHRCALYPLDVSACPVSWFSPASLSGPTSIRRQHGGERRCTRGARAFSITRGGSSACRVRSRTRATCARGLTVTWYVSLPFGVPVAVDEFYGERQPQAERKRQSCRRETEPVTERTVREREGSQETQSEM